LRFGSSKKADRNVHCEGGITIEKGVLSVDCEECQGRMELARPCCFNGLSERMLPGFQGSIVLKGKDHRQFEGSIVEALVSHSHILNDIRRLGERGASRKMANLSSGIEKEFKRDPAAIVERKEALIKVIRKAVRKNDHQETEIFLTIVEQTSKLIRKLERDIRREE